MQASFLTQFDNPVKGNQRSDQFYLQVCLLLNLSFNPFLNFLAKLEYSSMANPFSLLVVIPLFLMLHQKDSIPIIPDNRSYGH